MCGQHEGKLKQMKDDNSKIVKIAYPGQAVHVSGFKHFPEVGSPLYVVDDHKEANIIVDTLKKRKEQEETLRLLEIGDQSDEIKKSIGKLTKWEKRRIKAGDKTLLFQRLGIAEDEDIEKLKKRFGVKTKVDEQNIDEVLESKSNIGRRRSRRKLAQEQQVKDNLKSLIEERNQENEDMLEMDEDEIIEKQK